MNEPANTPYDFFVSYNGADQTWAEWIAWILEEKGGYRVKIQAWDIRPGHNFVLEMDEAARVSRRTILVLSPNFLKSQFVNPEWAAAFAKDPEGRDRRIVPVMVEACNPEGLLGPIAHIQLSGLDHDIAADTLLAGVKLGRAKPQEEPIFPGGAKGAEFDRPSSLWEPLSSAVSVQWIADAPHRRTLGAGPTTLEVHVSPIPGVILDSRYLHDSPEHLAAAGRSNGLFKTTDGLDVDVSDQRVCVMTTGARYQNDAGVILTRAGERAAWSPLPHDTLGSILDPANVEEQLRSLLSAAVNAANVEADLFAISMAIENVSMMAIGDAAQINHRNSVSMHFYSNDSIRIEADAATRASNLNDLARIADELTARLIANVGSQT